MKLDERGRAAAEGVRAAVRARPAASPQDVIDGFRRYRDRRDRRRRVGTVLVATVITIAVMVLLGSCLPGRAPEHSRASRASGRRDRLRRSGTRELNERIGSACASTARASGIFTSRRVARCGGPMAAGC